MTCVTLECLLLKALAMPGPTKLGFQATYILRNLMVYTFRNAQKLSKKKILWKPNLFKNQTRLGTNLGVFWKEETKAYLNENTKWCDT